VDPLGKVVVPYTPGHILEMHDINRWLVVMGRAPDTSYRGRCFRCRGKGVIGVDLRYRGFPRTSNFMCQACCDAMTDDERRERANEDTLLYIRCYVRRHARRAAGIPRKGP
jgi:hypothetical protein